MKYLLTLLIIVAVWRLYKWRLTQRIRAEQEAGAPAQPAGPRFITIVCIAILLVYGGYTLWHLVSRSL